MKSLNDQFTDALEEIGNYGPYQVKLDYQRLQIFPETIANITSNVKTFFINPLPTGVETKC